jgi:hypothetical protein
MRNVQGVGDHGDRGLIDVTKLLLQCVKDGEESAW